MTLRNLESVILVKSSNIELGRALPAWVRRRIARIASKYFARLNAASVYLSREGRSYRCTILIDIGALKIVTGEGYGFNCYLAFHGALRKVAKQLRRMKRALRDDKRRRASVPNFEVRRSIAEPGHVEPSLRANGSGPSGPGR
ncbi:MAG TPA: ribosome-associated translation inhibitor RaiA [Pseudolabrys sp.]|nr:ribosome-associated translation inhibitor RaiA [Pseudolabrys sp.]